MVLTSLMLILVLCGWSGAAEPAASRPAEGASETALEMVLPSLEFDEMDFESAVTYFRAVSEANIVVNWVALGNAGIDRDTPVTIQLSDTPLRSALRAVLQTAGGVVPLGFAVIDDAIWISTQEDLNTRTCTKVYDIRDLFSGEPAGEAVAELTECIRVSVAPDTWIANGGTQGSLRYLGGTFLVVQTYENHRALESLLNKLRGAGVQIQPSPAAQVQQAEPRMILVGNMKELCSDPQAMGIVALGSLRTEAGLDRADLVALLNGMIENNPDSGIDMVASRAMRNAVRMTLKDLYIEMGDTANATEQLKGIIRENDEILRHAEQKR
ncbi:MAG: hypothetical protein GX591_18170 [Planctomycetes bacterium]|nr:hypothetical protein [Planctomycetota bacterium]